MSGNSRIISFTDVNYQHNVRTPILSEASFSLKRGAKFTLMGQNGAGKSTLFNLITGDLKADDGVINVLPGASIAVSTQVISKSQLALTMREFFQSFFSEKIYNLDPKIDEVLDTVGLSPQSDEVKKNFKDRMMDSFSGGQQARLLLASALIQSPDILLLDEPTNNLDKVGIDHLTKFLKDYKKTVIVISHDAEFLNSFTEGVLYLSVQTRKIELYTGNYNDVLEEITAQVEKERRKNAQLEKTIQMKKDKANSFANKGGGMRMVAKRMREQVDESEENKVDVRKEDKTIRHFEIPVQKGMPLNTMTLTSYKVIKDHTPSVVECDLTFQRGKHFHIIGPNGIGKTTLLEALVSEGTEGKQIHNDVVVGYYRQDFSNLDFEQTVLECLTSLPSKKSHEEIRSVAAGFLLTGDVVYTKIGHLSEGQKGLVAFARLVLIEPGLLIMDEPTNHINFRHIPEIKKALDKFEGTLLLVSHVPEFVKDIRIDNVFDLGKKKNMF